MDSMKGLFGGSDDAGDSPLAGMFGGSGDPREDREGARDFINRVTTGAPHEGFSEQEAIGRLAQVSQRATPEQMQRAAQRALERMDDNQRNEFAQMLQERMGGVDRRGTGGGGGGMGMDDLSGMLGGLLGGGGMGGLLGGLLGGDSGGAGTSRSGGSGGMGDMFGGLLGSTAGKAALGGLAAYALSELLDGDR